MGFGDSGRRAIYFQGFGEKSPLFSGIWGDFEVLGSREQGAEEKHFGELGRKVIFLSGSREQRPPPGRASGLTVNALVRQWNVRSLVLRTEVLVAQWSFVTGFSRN